MEIGVALKLLKIVNDRDARNQKRILQANSLSLE